MSLWGNTDAANNVPKQTDTSGYGGDTPQVTGNGQVYFANTAIGDFIDGSGVPAHAGWVLRKVGTGPITSITSNAFGHLVNSYINFSTGGGKSGSGQIHANARVYVNSTGAVVNVEIGNTAGNYANTPTIANIYSSLHFVQNTAALTNKVTQGRANAVFTITVGGRAGRVQTETLVAMGSMIGDDANGVFDKG